MSTPVTGNNIPLAGFYDRVRNGTHDGKDYDRHLFVAGRIFQSAEANEMESMLQTRIKGIADALFKDGDIARDARCIVAEDPNNTSLVNVTLEGGAVYLSGAMRGVAPKSFTAPKSGTIMIGIWMVTNVVTSADDTTLLDPASGTRGYNEPGAERLQIIPTWGYQGDGTTGAQFFPIYYIDDGQLRAKELPPNLDAVTQAIARYDVDSNGSNYVVSGMNVSRMDDDATTGDFVFNIDAGRARVNGFGITLNTARRLRQSFVPDLTLIDSESFAPPSGGGTATYSVARPPMQSIVKLQVTRNVVEQVTRGQQADGRDSLSQPSAVRINKIYIPGAKPTDPHQKDYVMGTDWIYGKGTTGNDLYSIIDWSPSGQEPASGVKYSVDYDYTDANATPDKWDESTFTLSNIAKNGSILMTYNSMLPRIDRLVIDESGKFSWIIGVATNNNPVPPPVPSNVLALAQVSHTWFKGATGSKRNLDSVIADSVHVVSMSDLVGMNQRMDTLTEMIAQLNLVSDINTRDNTMKRGLFVDPFTSERNRDPSFTQSAALTANSLQLPIQGPTAGHNDNSTPSQDIVAQLSCDYVLETVLGNEARTGEMKVNPYMAFAPFPSEVTLNPSVDRWVRTETVWLSAETRYFTTTVYAPWTISWGTHGTTEVTGSNEVNELAGTTTRDDEYLREIDVNFTVRGFAPNETLTEVKFDNLVVTPQNP